MKIQALAALKPHERLTPYAYEAKPLAPYECLVRVRACGVCHSDVHMIDNDWSMSAFPLVAGHEAVGEVVETGAAVTHLKAGARVGVGWMRGACMTCEQCVGGKENLCDNVIGTIVGNHGGFADHVICDARFAFPIPAGIPTDAAGPLLCAGNTVYSGLRAAGMRSGQRIGVIGVGGLGHLAVQFAASLGNKVTVFTTSHDKAELAGKLGADEAVLLGSEAGPKRQLDIIMVTAPAPIEVSRFLNYVKPDGVLTFVGVGMDILPVPLDLLLAKRRRVMASPIGGRAEMFEMLRMADSFGVLPIVEVFPAARANDALDAVRKNTVRYRAVLKF